MKSETAIYEAIEVLDELGGSDNRDISDALDALRRALIPPRTLRRIAVMVSEDDEIASDLRYLADTLEGNEIE